MTKETKQTEREDEKTFDYEIVGGKYTAFDGKDEEGRAVRKTYFKGDVVKLTKAQAARLINVVRPVNYKPAKVEADDSVSLPGESLRPINEIGGGLPQNADKPAIIDPDKVDEVLAKEADQALDNDGKTTAPAGSTAVVSPAKDAGKK